MAIYAANLAAAALAEAAMTVLALHDGLPIASPRERRGHLLMGVSIPLVFCASIPIAYLPAGAAKWSRLSLVLMTRAQRHAGVIAPTRR